MLTALTVVNKWEKNFIKRIFSYIKGNKINVDVNEVRGVVLRHITYINRRGKINWSEIDKFVGIQRNHLLCSEYLKLPKSMGYKRFYSEDFLQRLCTNMALYILSKTENPQDLKVCLYDINGDSADILIKLLELCPETRVVTQNLDLYSKQGDMILEETGISPLVSCSTDCLEDCDLLIAPCTIAEELPISSKTVTLTCHSPLVEQKGAIYFRYHFKMPNKFEALKPQELTDLYFASALYTKARQHQLGSIVPMLCSNYASGARIESICTYFNNRA